MSSNKEADLGTVRSTSESRNAKILTCTLFTIRNVSIMAYQVVYNVLGESKSNQTTAN